MTRTISVSRTVPVLFLVSALTLGGCTGMSKTEQSTVSGGAIGAAAGAVGTVMTGGCVSCGAALGGAVGAGAGYIMGKGKEDDDK